MLVKMDAANAGGGVHFASGSFTIVSGTDKTIQLDFEPTIVSLVIDSSSYLYASSVKDTINNISSEFGRIGSSTSSPFKHDGSTIVINGNTITLPYISNNFNNLTCYWYATDYAGA